MRRLGVWLRAQPARLHALLAALVTVNVVVLFLLPWFAGLALQTTSLLVALVFVRANRGSGVS
jgi:hypothetical protein